MQKYKIIFILTALLLCKADNAPAEAGSGGVSIFRGPSLKLLSEYYANSSDFTRKSAGAEFGLSAPAGLHFEAGYVFSDFSQDGFDDIRRHSLFIQGDKEILENLSLSGRLSENFYDNDNENLNGGLFIRYQPSTNVFTEISFRHFDLIDTVMPFNNAIYSYVVTIGALERDIRSDDYKFYLLYTPVQRVSFAGELIYGDYSDNNEKRSLMFEAGYQLFDTPYLRTAYNYFYLDIKDPAPLAQGRDKVESAYWDPVNFETHTLRLEYRQDYNMQLAFGAEGAVSYSPKSGGVSRAVFLYAAYKFTKQLSMRLDARWFDQDKGIDRLEETDRYRAENYNMVFQYNF